MRIELERLIAPETNPATCALCEREFQFGVVVARALTESRVDCGEVCPECASWLGKGPMAAERPAKFPPADAFKYLEAQWKTPIYASFEEAEWEDRR
jgi:hypothetical protein